jgi:AraC family transcriptional regulator
MLKIADKNKKYWTQMKNQGEIEVSLKCLEKALNVKITIIDRYGIFHFENGEPLLGKIWQSHQKNEVCRIGFRHDCVMHCRHEINEKGERLKRPFIHKCWKGVSELVVPLVVSDTHYGSLFAGIWRDAEFSGKVDAKLSADFFRAWQTLPLIKTVDMKMLESILAVYTRGMFELLEEKKPFGRMIESRKMLVRNFIHAGASGKLMLEKLAGKLHLSVSRTSHLVKSIFGRSFQELVLAERINRAKALLLSTDCSSKEISGLTGFSDEYFFNRTFKKHCDITPGKYRKMNKGGR